jgi:hypothetical protein
MGRSPHGAATMGGHAGLPTADWAVALIDERFVLWLGAQPCNLPADTDGAAPAPAANAVHRKALMPVLRDALRACAPGVELLRTCVFTEAAMAEPVDDVLPRTVPPHAADGGLGLVRALGLEIQQLALRGGCGWLMVASDDERLLPYLDEAQWRGLKVILLADESSLDLPRLAQDDPSWARLLAQADRRQALSPLAMAALCRGDGGFMQAQAAPLARGVAPLQTPFQVPFHAPMDDPAQAATEDWHPVVQEVIAQWWAEETPHARLDLYDEMQGSQGVPAETDRHLLLRARRARARPVSVQEKKARREMIRDTVLAAQPSLPESPLEA